MLIESADAEQVAAERVGLRELVRDSVEGGSSIGFVLPFAHGELDEYVDLVIDQVARGSRVVVVARDGERVAGMAQLELSAKANARHRAEVQKVVVHSEYRRRGLARALMNEVERVARELGRTLLVLDTEQGSPAEDLYVRCGYTKVGVIPRYAVMARGGLVATVVFFKDLS
jgi:ribosomal protein S18 acetylase RimI-like enzyme